jgi:hypothetical protein
LTTLAWFGQPTSFKIHNGNASMPGGAVKMVSTTSSNLSPNACRAPAANLVTSFPLGHFNPITRLAVILTNV